MTPPSIHPLRGPNRFKLGIFAMNADGGLALTRVPERWPAAWPGIVRVARMADQAGIEFILPIARWKGFGGAQNSREHSFETFTFAAALAGVTERIGLFATVHVPMVHPVFAAKALATLDHASNGRAGLNVVCGWNPEEFGLFGLPMIEDRYGQGREWLEIVSRLYADTAPFDYHGAHYTLTGVSGRPLPVQLPRPLTLNAAFSPPGRDFAARAVDLLFTTFPEIEAGRAVIADMQARAAAYGRSVGVFTTCHVVCRPSQAEAEDYYDRYTVRLADDDGLDRYMQTSEKFSRSHAPEAYRLHRQRFAGGVGTYPLVGTPRAIAEQMVQMSAAGFAGTTLSVVNFEDELPYIVSDLLPLLRDAGLRDA